MAVGRALGPSAAFLYGGTFSAHMFNQMAKDMEIDDDDRIALALGAGAATLISEKIFRKPWVLLGL